MATLAGQFRPWRLILAFVAITAGLYALVFFTPGSNNPKLGIDLQGGTRITLTARTADGSVPPRSSMLLARDIMERRVNGSGVAGAEVQIDGNSQLVITVPGTQDLTNLTRSAQLNLRPVVTSQAQTHHQRDRRRRHRDVRNADVRHRYQRPVGDGRCHRVHRPERGLGRGPDPGGRHHHCGQPGTAGRPGRGAHRPDDDRRRGDRRHQHPGGGHHAGRRPTPPRRPVPVTRRPAPRPPRPRRPWRFRRPATRTTPPSPPAVTPPTGRPGRPTSPPRCRAV